MNFDYRFSDSKADKIVMKVMYRFYNSSDFTYDSSGNLRQGSPLKMTYFCFKEKFLLDLSKTCRIQSNHLISARPQRQTNANECRIVGDLDQLESKDTVQKR